MRIARNTVVTLVDQKLCVGVERLKEKKDVYCLATEAAWLEVNGLIASNCDEIRYACMSRPYVRQLDRRPETRILGVGPHNQVTLNDLWEHQPKAKQERV